MNDKPNIFSNIKAATIIFLIKIGRYNYYNIANLADKHLLYKDKNGITLLEYILKSDEQFNSFNEFASASKENPEIAFILCKCNKGHLLNFSISEDDLFLKFDNKPLIQIIMKQADIRYSYWLISNIINHPEIVDIIIESKSKKEIRSYKALEALNEKIINKLIEPDDKGNYINLSKYSNDENYKEILIIILKKS